MVTIFCTNCKRETNAEQLVGPAKGFPVNQRWNKCLTCMSTYPSIARVRHRLQARKLERAGQVAFNLAEERRRIYANARRHAKVPRPG
ncbi:MAG: hypothetical protein NW202_13330 [Nitrospira sp.]|nr:hypothetical protein [Nitrospira sp.]